MLHREAFEVLGLAPETPLDAVKAHYRRMVKELHPDSGTFTADIDLARLVEAYRTIAVSNDRAPTSIFSGTRATGTAPRSRGASSRTRTAPGGRRARGTGGDTVEDVFRLGRRATEATEAAERLRAVRALAAGGRRTAAVFLRQALFDSNADVACAAAESLVGVKGAAVERDLIRVFDDLTVHQRLAVLGAVARSDRRMDHLIAFAAADRSPRVRRCAEELLA